MVTVFNCYNVYDLEERIYKCAKIINNHLIQIFISKTSNKYQLSSQIFHQGASVYIGEEINETTRKCAVKSTEYHTYIPIYSNK